MVKKVLTKIQADKEYTLPLIFTLKTIDSFEQINIERQHLSELARIHEDTEILENLRSKLLYIVDGLEIDDNLDKRFIPNDITDVPSIKDLSEEVNNFLSKYESELRDTIEHYRELKKAHIIADKLLKLKNEYDSGSIPIDFMVDGPSTYCVLGEVDKSYQDVITFYLNELTKGKYISWSSELTDSDNIIMFILSLKNYKDKIAAILHDSYFQPIDIDINKLFEFLESKNDDTNVTINQIHDIIAYREDEDIKPKIDHYKSDLKDLLVSYILKINFIIELIKIEENARTINNVFTIWGWVDKDIYDDLVKKLLSLPFEVKVRTLDDVPFKYKKKKKKKEKKKMKKKEKTEKATEHKFHFPPASKGGALFPKKVEFIRLVSPKEHKREFISLVQNLNSIHQEKIGTQDEQEQEAIKSAQAELINFQNRIKKLVDLLEINDHKVKLDNPYLIYDDYQESIKFISDFLSKYEDRVVSLTKELKTLKEQKDQLEIYLPFERYFKEDSRSLLLLGENFETVTFVGTISAKNLKPLKFFLGEITDGQLVFLEFSDNDSKSSDVSILVLSLKLFEESMQKVFSEFSFKPIRFSKDLIGDTSVQDKLAKVISEIEEKEEKIQSLKEELIEPIKATLELINIELERLRTEENCVTDDTTISLWGWIPSKEFNKLEHIINEAGFNIKITKIDSVPLTNPSYSPKVKPMFKALRGIVNGMGVPGVNEIDPFHIVQFTFPLIFGLMFADVGHGLLLMLLGLYFAYKKRKNQIEPSETLTGYIYAGSELLAICGFSATIFGFLFGALLGDDLFLANIYHNVFHIHWLPIIKPVEEVTFYLVFTLILGFIIMQTGLWLDFVQNKKYAHKKSAWIAPIILSIFYVALFAVLYNIVAPSASCEACGLVLQPIGKPYNTIILVVITITIPLIFIIEFLHSGSEGITEAIEYILELFSNSLSFSRILAMLLVHAILSGLPYIFANINIHETSPLMQSWVFWVVGIVWGVIFIIPVEGLFSFLQTLRLHWVEFFSKFYKGTGKEFVPLSESHKFVQFIKQDGT